MQRLRYLRELFSRPIFKRIGVTITILGAYDLFISQFIQRKFQDKFPIISDIFIRLAWPWYVWVIILFGFFLFVFFESGFELLKQYTIHPVLKELTKLRIEGVSLWHKGKLCKNQEEVDKWWNKHLYWRERCAQVTEKFDESLAGEIRTLGTENGFRFYNGISKDHNHKVLMQSAWNNRLDEVIKEIRSISYKNFI